MNDRTTNLNSSDAQVRATEEKKVRDEAAEKASHVTPVSPTPSVDQK